MMNTKAKRYAPYRGYPNGSPNRGYAKCQKAGEKKLYKNSQGDRNQNTKIASYWSKWALIWDPMFRLARLDQKYRKDAISVLCLEKGQTVLDVACSTGLNFSYLQNRHFLCPLRIISSSE
jgi:hypothetical protein